MATLNEEMDQRYTHSMGVELATAIKRQVAAEVERDYYRQQLTKAEAEVAELKEQLEDLKDMAREKDL